MNSRDLAHEPLKKIYTMLTITETAAAKLTHYMRENGQGKAVRIKLRSGG
jgi:Fe-S cluster assembly iron-binding protein IscA